MLQTNGKTATGLRVPDDVVHALSTSRKPAVRVSFRGFQYRSTVASMGGVFMLPVSAAVRAASGVVAGELLDVEIELDTEPREIEVPADLAEALHRDEAAGTFFDGLSYSNKRRITLAIEGANTAETRQRRIDKAVLNLSSGVV